VEIAATTPLVQPQPIWIEPAAVLPQPQKARPEPPAVDRCVSGGVIQPPIDLHDMGVMTPEQLREQLPMPSFVNVAKPLTDISPPPRADTPPPPPPSSIPQFANYMAQSYISAPTFAAPANASESATLQWVANTNAEVEMSPASKRGDLPVFSANGVIPFASQQGAAPQVKREKTEDIWEVPDTPAR
jgi:histone deacetylase HOS3